MLENYKEVVEALEDTNESVISHRVNEILRVLTSFSVIVLPLTFIASLWGMNVGVPGEGDMAAFWIIAGAMVALLVGMVAFFRRRGWLCSGRSSDSARLHPPAPARGGAEPGRATRRREACPEWLPRAEEVNGQRHRKSAHHLRAITKHGLPPASDRTAKFPRIEAGLDDSTSS